MSNDHGEVMRLNQTDDAITAHEYPTTSDELITAHGDESVEFTGGTETVGEILARLEDTTYENPEEVREALFSAVSAEAIGRRYYSDRDPGTPGSFGPQQISF